MVGVLIYKRGERIRPVVKLLREAGIDLSLWEVKKVDEPTPVVVLGSGRVIGAAELKSLLPPSSRGTISIKKVAILVACLFLLAVFSCSGFVYGETTGNRILSPDTWLLLSLFFIMFIIEVIIVTIFTKKERLKTKD